jgi:hypothetical protein
MGSTHDRDRRLNFILEVFIDEVAMILNRFPRNTLKSAQLDAERAVLEAYRNDRR